MHSVRYRGAAASVRMALARRFLRFILAGRDADALPAHVLMPGDEVSNEILIAGMHEGQLLQPLFAHYLAAQLPDLAETVALDVGANIGNHSLFFSRYFNAVVAVEPNPRTLHVLRANVGLSGADIRVLPMGFGEASGSLPFFSNTQGNLGASGFAYAKGPTDGRNGARIECAVRRGDEALEEVLEEGERIGLIKLDVEGAELSALRGLGARLHRDQPFVIFESLRTEGEAGGAAIFSFLAERGYTRFYAVESSVTSATGSLVQWCRRLVQGERVGLRRIERPEPGRAYLMILATPATRHFEPA